jgi:hypothetical protein
MTTHLVEELDRLTRENGTEHPSCPICKGKVELTPTHAIVCVDYGSDHYRWELPAVEVREPKPSGVHGR